MSKDCRETALRYLERRARTAYEVKARLLSKGFSEEEVAETLRYLQELGYLDDAGYCGEYIRYGMEKGRGPLRLEAELAEKGIDAALIRGLLAAAFDMQSEKDAAMGVAYKILKNDTNVTSEEEPDLAKTGRPDEKTVARSGRKLASLGYHDEVIDEVIGRLIG